MIDIEKMHASISKIRHIFGDDVRATQSLGEVFELITILREAEKDAARYRWIKLNVENDDADFVLERPISEWDCAIDEVMKQAMKDKGDE